MGKARTVPAIYERSNGGRYDVIGAARASCDHRHAASERFDQHYTECFNIGAMQQDIGVLQCCAHATAARLSDKKYALMDAEFSRQLNEWGVLRASASDL
jgi:hypothetical protein